MFKDRGDAGRRLGEALARDPGGLSQVVFGLPRGGVIVAAEVAHRLAAPLDVIVVRKLGAPGQSELAVGAIASGDELRIIRNEPAIRACRLTDRQLEAIREAEAHELRDRVVRYRDVRKQIDASGAHVVIVDDGMATGSTARAAVLASSSMGAGRVTVGVPVASPEAVRLLEGEADDVVCLHAPVDFKSVGQYYEDFSQVTDDQVRSILEAAR